MSTETCMVATAVRTLITAPRGL